MNNDLELLPINGSLRGRAKSSRPRRQGQNCRRRSQSYVEDDFDPTTQASGFAAGRSRAGLRDTLLNMQNEPNLKNSQINVSLSKTKDYENKCPSEHQKNEPNLWKTNPIHAQGISGKLPQFMPKVFAVFEQFPLIYEIFILIFTKFYTNSPLLCPLSTLHSDENTNFHPLAHRKFIPKLAPKVEPVTNYHLTK